MSEAVVVGCGGGNGWTLVDEWDISVPDAPNGIAESYQGNLRNDSFADCDKIRYEVNGTIKIRHDDYENYCGSIKLGNGYTEQHRCIPYNQSDIKPINIISSSFLCSNKHSNSSSADIQMFPSYSSSNLNHLEISRNTENFNYCITGANLHVKIYVK